MSQDDDAARWREAAGLRREFPRWVVIWLASEAEFRAYRRLPGTRRDTTLRAPTSQDMAAKIAEAEQSAQEPRPAPPQGGSEPLPGGS